MQIIVILLLIIIIPIFSYLHIENWNHFHKPTVKPTNKPITVSPTRPTCSPTPQPTMPTFLPSIMPTTPTMNPTTYTPTVYDFKTMNYNGYIATLVISSYIIIVCICGGMFLIVVTKCCNITLFITEK